MKKIGIIGLGKISDKYRDGLENSNYFKLTAVCDLNENAFKESCYQKYSYYKDFSLMLKNEKLDYVLIATAPKSHFPIAYECLNLGVNVIMEKPACVKQEDLNVLYNFAESKNLSLDIMFHWVFGQEVQYLKNTLLPTIEVKDIEVCVNDNYACKDNKIEASRIGLQGTFLDSGINALSFLLYAFDFKKVELVSRNYTIDKNCNLPMYSNHIYKCDDKNVSIMIDWTKDLNYKRSTLTLKDGSIININHSKQTILKGDEILYSDESKERLSRHYYNYLANFPSMRMSKDFVLKCHKLLFEGNINNEEL